MAHQLHAIKVGEKFKFRLWSTVSDGYLTEEMSESEARVQMEREDRSSAVDYRINLAKNAGTDAYGRRSLERWNKEIG